MENNMDDEELGYVSSSPMLATAPKEVKSQDEVDLPVLIRVNELLREQIASYLSIERLVVEEKDLTVQQQLAVNKAVSAHLNQIQLMVDTIITKAKGKYE